MGHRFADFELDPLRRELRQGSRLIHLQPRVFDLLLYLVEHHERVVPKGELLDQIWQGAAVSDAALVSAIRDARVAVGDDGHRQEIIRTIPRVGLRFVAPVHRHRDRESLLEPWSAPAGSWRCEMLLELAEERSASGDYHRGGRDLFRQAAELARRGACGHLFARAALGFGEVSHGIALGDSELVGLLEEALELIREEDEEGRKLGARLRARLAIELGTVERGRANRLVRAALPEARRSRDDRGLADALLGRLILLSGPRHLRERREMAHQILVEAEEGHGDAATWGHHFVIASALEAGDRAQLDSALVAAARHAGGLHHTELFGFVEAGRAAWEGRFQVAHSLLARMVAFEDLSPLVGFGVNTVILQGWLAWLTGDPLPEGWRKTLYERVPDDYSLAVRATDAFLSAETGDSGAAEAAYESSVDELLREDMLYLYTLTALAHTAVSLGDSVRGERLSRQLRPHAARIASGMATHHLGSIHRALGNLAGLAGRQTEAVNHLSTALRVELHMLARPFAALTRRDLARALMVSGDRERAQRELRRCISEADALGMTSLREDAMSLLSLDEPETNLPLERRPSRAAPRLGLSVADSKP